MMLSTISSIVKNSSESAANHVTNSNNNNKNNHLYVLNNKTEHDLIQLYRNITNTLAQLQKTRHKDQTENSEPYYDDNSNAWMYILFVLTFYAFSIAVLMVKYIKREREGSKLEFYYNEFVKRDWYKDKNLYDNRGRRIHYNEDGSKVITTEKRKPRALEDPDLFLDSDNEEDEDLSNDFETQIWEKQQIVEKPVQKKSVVLCLENSSSNGMVTLVDKCPVLGYENSGARPKRSSLKNWPPTVQAEKALVRFPPRLRAHSFHQQSLDDALEMRNLTVDEEREFARMRSRSRLLQPLMLGPSLIPLDEDDSSLHVSDEDEIDSVTDDLAFLPNRTKLAYCKVDETMQQVPQLLTKDANGRPGLNMCSFKLKLGQSVFSDDSSLNSVPISDDTTGNADTTGNEETTGNDGTPTSSIYKNEF